MLKYAIGVPIGKKNYIVVYYANFIILPNYLRKRCTNKI